MVEVNLKIHGFFAGEDFVCCGRVLDVELGNVPGDVMHVSIIDSNGTTIFNNFFTVDIRRLSESKLACSLIFNQAYENVRLVFRFIHGKSISSEFSIVNHILRKRTRTYDTLEICEDDHEIVKQLKQIRKTQRDTEHTLHIMQLMYYKMIEVVNNVLPTQDVVNHA
jgi:hypothetical protein